MTPSIELTDGQKAFLDVPRKAIIATTCEDGRAVQCVVYYVRDGDTLWISCSPDSVKVANLRRDPRMAILVVSDTEPSYLAIDGKATVVEDVETVDRLLLMRRYIGEERARLEVAKKPLSRPNARIRIFPTDAFGFNVWEKKAP